VKKKLPDGAAKPGKFRLPDAASADRPRAQSGEQTGPAGQEGA